MNMKILLITLLIAAIAPSVAIAERYDIPTASTQDTQSLNIVHGDINDNFDKQYATGNAIHDVLSGIGPIIEQSADPTLSGTTQGELIIATGSNKLFVRTTDKLISFTGVIVSHQGPEIFTSFTALQTGWVDEGSGVYSVDGSNTVISHASQANAIPATTGGTFYVSITVDSISAGSVRLSIQGYNGAPVGITDIISAPGTYTFTLDRDHKSTTITCGAEHGTVAQISAISVREVL